MRLSFRRRLLPVAVASGAVALVGRNEPFLLQDGHLMRTARCPVCHDVIGSQPATLLGAVGLDGSACDCGHVVGDVFLLHARHIPLEPDVFQAMLVTAFYCGDRHE